MVTKIRLIDTFLPVAKGGTYCIPGPFGAGKTVLQHLTSKNADVDVVIIAACGKLSITFLALPLVTTQSVKAFTAAVVFT